MTSIIAPAAAVIQQYANQFERLGAKSEYLDPTTVQLTFHDQYDLATSSDILRSTVFGADLVLRAVAPDIMPVGHDVNDLAKRIRNLEGVTYARVIADKTLAVLANDPHAVHGLQQLLKPTIMGRDVIVEHDQQVTSDV